MYTAKTRQKSNIYISFDSYISECVCTKYLTHFLTMIPALQNVPDHTHLYLVHFCCSTRTLYSDYICIWWLTKICTYICIYNFFNQILLSAKHSHCLPHLPENKFETIKTWHILLVFFFLKKKTQNYWKYTIYDKHKMCICESGWRFFLFLFGDLGFYLWIEFLFFFNI